MSLFLSLLPLYLFGNLHCLGMCGPLVMMIGHHRYRLFYFFGRTFSYSMAGWLAGEAGAALNVFLKVYHISALTSFFFGGLILLVGFFSLLNLKLPLYSLIPASLNKSLSILMLRDQPWPAFLFGFLTVFLPCGQTLVVFSACALYGDPIVGLLNGGIFAILTSPSLFAAMQAHSFFQKARKYYNVILGVSSLAVGILALCRGFADMGFISHFILNPESHAHYHLVIY